MVQASNTVIHDGETITSRVIEAIRTMKRGETFTSMSLRDQMGLPNTNAVSATLHTHQYEGLYRVAGGRRRTGHGGRAAYVYEVTDPASPISLNNGCGHKITRNRGSGYKAKGRPMMALTTEFAAALQIPERLVPQVINLGALEPKPVSLAEQALSLAVAIEDYLKQPLATIATEDLIREMMRRGYVCSVTGG